METKICRICGKLSENYVHIFKREGLKNKIETCLPIIVSPHSLLPDTICSECSENVDNFYSFIKNCLQNIIILEAQYDIHESCLKTKRKHEKSCMTELSLIRYDKNVQTDEDFSDIIFLKEKSSSFTQKLAEVERILTNNDIDFTKFSPIAPNKKSVRLVDYDVESDNSEEDANEIIGRNRNFVYNHDYFSNTFSDSRGYFDDTENNLINEIKRKSSKRKSQDIIYNERTKMFKMDNSSRRKSRQPKKLETKSSHIINNMSNWNFEQRLNDLDTEKIRTCDRNVNPPYACLLCDAQLESLSLLAAHVYEVHGIDMAEVLSSEPVMEKKKKLPNLVKITDLKPRPDKDQGESKHTECAQEEQPPTLLPSIVCPVCPSVFTTRPDLFNHLRTKHAEEFAFLCGLCLSVSTSFANLNIHVENCRKTHTITNKYICKICGFNDDNGKLMENHVLIHDFVLAFCKQQSKIFDPSDYIELNLNSESCNKKTFQCSECGANDFITFKDFSEHRRNQHQIFHCDLCNKFYGRNSHLWKHVNRLHKGHPSITCQLCYKTSASKYHLAQHFNKLHNAKNVKNNAKDDFLSQKFEAFDFQSVRQSFMKQELLEQSKELSDENSDDYNMPKEIDASSDLYTNIITNYTPPQEGEFKCPKCFKGFEMKVLLKKHKKNCRPRLQKDLLTRCKTCSRIFKDRQSLTKHLINYHSDYACEICEQKVQSKCEIVSHIRFSHPNCHLFCHCGNILRNTGDLIKHQIDHCNSFVCQFCGDTLETKIKLKMHILSLHRKILSLSCGICLKLFETQHILRDHVRLAHKDHLKPFVSCTVCGKNYGSKWKTYDHLNKSHGRIFKACKICLEIFDTEEELQNHYDNKHSGTQKTETKETYESDYEDEKNSLSDYDFEICEVDKRLLRKGEIHKKKLPKEEPTQGTSNSNTNSNINSSSNLNSNSNSKRTVYVNSNDPSLCEICKKTWPAKKHLWQHYIRCHKTVAATVCGICLKANDSYETLQQHLRDTHPTLLHGQGFGSNFICRICGRYHNASSKLKLHMAIHENFDWSILDKPKEPEQPTSNGYYSNNSTGINYESLIEQVECTSESEVDSDVVKIENHVNRSNSSSDNESDNESNMSDLESEMLKNMIMEKKSNEKLTVHNEVTIKQEYTSSESEESTNSTTYSEVKIENSTSDDENTIINSNTNDSISNNVLYEDVCDKAQELDSAIRSISYEEIEQIDEKPIIQDYVEIQNPNLNQHELQSAVDSIL